MGNAILAADATVSSPIRNALFRPRASLQSGLSHCYDLRTSAAAGLVNTMTGTADATEVGSPTWASDGVTISQNNGISWPFLPTGRQTLAVIIQNKPAPYLDADSNFLGSFTAAGEVAQYWRWDNNGFNDRITYELSEYSNYDTFSTTRRAEIAMFSGTNMEFFAATVEDYVGVSMYHPRTSGSNTGAATAGNRFTPPEPQYMDSSGAMVPITNTEKLLLVARWSRVLTSGEVSSFYADAKAFYAARGVTVA